MKSVAPQIYEILKSLFPQSVSLHEPRFQGNELRYVQECIDTGWVSSVGKYVDRFEKELANWTGVKHAVATVNGTAALHIALKLGGVKSGDEVLTPTLSFGATANAISYCQAIPHFVDSEEKTLGVDCGKLEKYLEEVALLERGFARNRHTGRPIRALVVMHTFGHPVDMEAASRVAEHFQLTLIEDAAESLGSFYKDKHTGNWSKLAAMSFNGNKIITTGGGGAILTNDSELASLAKHLTTTAKVPHPWAFVHDQIGYNYRLPNINAALGCAQLEVLPTFLQKKRELAQAYQDAFINIDNVKISVEPDYAKSNYWLNILLLNESKAHERDRILEITNQEGIMTRPAWTLMHHLDHFSQCPKMDLSQSEGLENRLICLPSSPHLADIAKMALSNFRS